MFNPWSLFELVDLIGVFVGAFTGALYGDRFDQTRGPIGFADAMEWQRAVMVIASYAVGLAPRFGSLRFGWTAWVPR